jgi:hypothetical protein
MDYSFERGLYRNRVERLAALEFVKEGKELSLSYCHQLRSKNDYFPI